MNTNTILNLDEPRMIGMSITFKNIIQIICDSRDLVVVFAKINEVRSANKFGIEVVLGLKEEHELYSKPSLALKKEQKGMVSTIKSVCRFLGFEMYAYEPDISMQRNQKGETLRIRMMATSIPLNITKEEGSKSLVNFIDFLGLDVVSSDNMDGFYGYEVKPKDIETNMKDTIHNAARIGRVLIGSDDFYIYPSEGFEAGLDTTVTLSKPEPKRQFNIEEAMLALGKKLDEKLIPNINYKLYELGCDITSIKEEKKSIIVDLYVTSDASLSVAKMTELATEFRKMAMGQDFRFQLNTNSMIASLLNDSKSIIYNPNFKETENKLVKVEDIQLGGSKDQDYSTKVNKIISKITLGLTSLKLTKEEEASITPFIHRGSDFGLKFQLDMSSRGINEVTSPKIDPIRSVIVNVATHAISTELHLTPNVTSGVSETPLGEFVMSVAVTVDLNINEMKHTDYTNINTVMTHALTVDDVMKPNFDVPYSRTYMESFFAWLSLMKCKTELREHNETVAGFTVFHTDDFNLVTDVRRAILTFRNFFRVPFIRLSFIDMASTRKPTMNQVEEILLYLESFKEVKCDVSAHPNHIELSFKKATLEEIALIRDTINFAYTSKDFKAFNSIIKPKKVLILNEVPNVPKEVGVGVVNDEYPLDGTHEVARKLKSIFDVFQYTTVKNNMKTITDLKVILDDNGLVMDIASSLYDVHIPMISLLNTRGISDAQYLSALKLISEFWKKEFVYYKMINLENKEKVGRSNILDRADSVVAYMFGGLDIHIHSVNHNVETDELTIVTVNDLDISTVTLIKNRSKAAFGYRSGMKLFINPLGSRSEQEAKHGSVVEVVEVPVAVETNNNDLVLETNKGKDMIDSKEVISWLMDMDVETTADTFAHIQALGNYLNKEEIALELKNTNVEKSVNLWLLTIVRDRTDNLFDLVKMVRNLVPNYEAVYEFNKNAYLTDYFNLALYMGVGMMEDVKLSGPDVLVLNASTTKEKVYDKLVKAKDVLRELYEQAGVVWSFTMEVSLVPEEAEPVHVDAVVPVTEVNPLEALSEAIETMDEESNLTHFNSVSIKDAIEDKLNPLLKDHVGVEINITDEKEIELDFYYVEGEEAVETPLDDLIVLMGEYKEIKGKYGYDFKNPKEALDWFEPSKALEFFGLKDEMESVLSVLF